MTQLDPGRLSPLAAAKASGRADESMQTWSAGRKFATGVAVVTAGSDEDAHGATVSAFTYISWSPALVSICITPDGALLNLLVRRGVFAVSVLGCEQANLARQFSDPRRRPGLGQFEAVGWVPGADGKVPLLLGAVAWLDCRYLRHEAIGDHEFVLAEVSAVAHTEAAPLLYFNGNLYPAAIKQEVHP